MNKLLIVLLALCLVTVHGFVKREAPAPSNDNFAADIGKSMKDLLDSFGAQIRESLNPEEIRKNVNSIVDEVQKSIDKFKTSSQPAKN